MSDPEVTLEKINNLLGEAKVAELSKDKVYLIVFDQSKVNPLSARGILDQLVRMEIKIVAIFSGEREAIEVYTFDPKRPELPK